MIRQIALVLRQVMKTPAFTLAVVFCLSLGTGANVAVFSVAHAVLSRPLPFERPEEIVLLSQILDGIGTPLNAVQVAEIRSAARGIALAARTNVPVMFNDGTGASMIETELVTASYFETVLRPRSLLGRTFVAADDEPTAVAPMLISRQMWQRRFNDDPNVVGRHVRINGRDAVIIG